MTQENEEVKVKPRGPKYTPPLAINLPSTGSYTSWKKSLDAQVAYQKSVSEEAKKFASIPGYKGSMKISKKYKMFFNEEIADARQRAKRKRRK